MRILVLSTKPPWPPRDGGAAATLMCIKGLAHNGAEVSVLAIKTRKHQNTQPFDLSQVPYIKTYDQVNIDTSIRPHRLISNIFFSGEPYDLARFVSPAFIERLSYILKTQSFDLIQCEGLVFAMYLSQIRNIFSGPVVLRAHNLEHRIREMMSRNATTVIERIYLRSLSSRVRKKEIFAASHFDAIVAISRPDMEWFTSLNHDKPVHLTPAGTDTRSDASPGATDNMRAGFIGALDWKPNADALLWFIKQVWPYVSKRMPAASFHIAGRNAPDSLIAELKGKNIVFEGEVADSKVFISSVSVMIAPLFSGSGMRIKIIEAMSLGKPVIATPAAATGIPVTDGRDILIAGDQYMFSSHLMTALSRPEIRVRLASAALELVRRHYDNNTLTLELLDFYKNLNDGC